MIHQPSPRSPYLHATSALPFLHVLDDPKGRLRSRQSGSTNLAGIHDDPGETW